MRLGDLVSARQTLTERWWAHVHACRACKGKLGSEECRAYSKIRVRLDAAKSAVDREFLPGGQGAEMMGLLENLSQA